MDTARQAQSLNEAVSISHSTNTLEKGTQLIILSQAMIEQ